MIRQRWNLSQDEVIRILSMHENATKNHYLIKEQTVVTKTIEPKKFQLPNNSFKGGKYLTFDKTAVDNVINQMNEYLKNFPKNQRIEVEVESSESKVTNYDREKYPSTGNSSVDYQKEKRLSAGQLSKLRAQTLENYLKTKLPENVTITIKDLGAQGPDWIIPRGATTDQIVKLANDPKYTQYQYVSFNIVGSGEAQEEICDLGFYVIVDYQKEWCKEEDKSRCHKCDDAVFLMWANGVSLTTKDGDPYINLNNNEGRGISGPSREVRLFVSVQQKQQILEKNPEEILITYGCALNDCHSDPAHVTIISTNGTVLLPPTFITSGGKRMKKTDPPVNLLKLDRCGRKIAVAGEESMVVPPPKPLVKAFKLEYDDKINIKVESLYELYKFVENGILKIPKDKLEEFRSFKHYNNKPWASFLDTYSNNISNKLLKDLEVYAKSKKGQ